jgi:hypothetical protein
MLKYLKTVKKHLKNYKSMKIGKMDNYQTLNT